MNSSCDTSCTGFALTTAKMIIGSSTSVFTSVGLAFTVCGATSGSSGSSRLAGAGEDASPVGERERRLDCWASGEPRREGDRTFGRAEETESGVSMDFGDSTVRGERVVGLLTLKDS